MIQFLIFFEEFTKLKHYSVFLIAHYIMDAFCRQEKKEIKLQRRGINWLLNERQRFRLSQGGSKPVQNQS